MDEVLEQLTAQLSSIDELCLPNLRKTNELTGLLKDLYNESSRASSRPLGPLPELHVESVDAETIWEELQSKNRPLKRLIKTKTKRLLKSLTRESHNVDEDSVRSDADPPSSFGAAEEEHQASSDDLEEENEGQCGEDSEEVASESCELQGEGNFSDSEHEEMERWLDDFEDLEDKHRQKLERGAKKGGHKGAVEDTEEDDFDFVASNLYDIDSDEEAENAAEGAEVMAKDFFGPSKSKKNKSALQASKDDGRSQRKDSGKLDAKAAALRRAEEEDDYYVEGEDLDVEDDDWDDNGPDDYEEDVEEEEVEGDDGPQQRLSKHQQQQAKMAEKIAALEREALNEKSWDMRGETRAVDRPENSLLGVTIDVERASKPAPIVTQEYTTTLEDMILQRVKMGKYDDVIPREIREKHGAVDEEDFQLSQEKSKHGLGDIYADEFMKKSMLTDGSSGAREQEARDKDEITNLYQKVCRQLDALSHFHFAPKPVVADAKITTSAPSISMEEIGPTTENIAIASSQAPEEVFTHKRGRDAAFMAEEELTRDDKKRLRRAMKTVRRKQQHEVDVEEKLAAKVNPVLGKRYEDKKAEKSMQRDKRVVDGNSMRLESDDKVKSFSKSSSFFSAMQKQSEEDIQRKKDKVRSRDKSSPATGSNGSSININNKASRSSSTLKL